MSVLAENISVIVRYEALEAAYPGGVEAYACDCPNDSFCTDGDLARVAFLSPHDARLFVGMLEAHGLVAESRGCFVEVAVVEGDGGPLAPCLWLEHGEHRGHPACWLAGHPPGDLLAPRAWQRRDAHDERLSRRLRYIKTEENRDWYHDRHTGDLIAMDRAIVTH